MALRVGFDLDGVLADYESALRELEIQLFGPEDPGEGGPGGDPDDLDSDLDGDVGGVEEATAADERRARRIHWQRQRAISRAIEQMENFWTALTPVEPGAVARIHQLALQYRWEVFFITQRPQTAGESVQRQTQHWLVAQGYDQPSVIVVRGSRGKLAESLQLDYLVDDRPKNCVDVLSESPARPLLVLRRPDPITKANAMRLGILVTESISEGLDWLEQASRDPGSLLERLARKVRWKGHGSDARASSGT